MNQTEDQTAARLKNCFSRVFPKLSEDRIAQASPAVEPSWDSLASLTLLTLIGEEFDVQLDMDDLEGAVSFQGILSLLNQQLV